MKKKNANIETKKYTYHLLILSLRYFIKQIKFKKEKKKKISYSYLDYFHYCYCYLF